MHLGRFHHHHHHHHRYYYCDDYYYYDDDYYYWLSDFICNKQIFLPTILSVRCQLFSALCIIFLIIFVWQIQLWGTDWLFILL